MRVSIFAVKLVDITSFVTGLHYCFQKEQTGEHALKFTHLIPLNLPCAGKQGHLLAL